MCNFVLFSFLEAIHLLLKLFSQALNFQNLDHKCPQSIPGCQFLPQQVHPSTSPSDPCDHQCPISPPPPSSTSCPPTSSTSRPKLSHPATISPLIPTLTLGPIPHWKPRKNCVILPRPPMSRKMYKKSRKTIIIINQRENPIARN